MQGHILICDDEELIRDSLATYLGEQGFVVQQAKDGVECIEKLENSLPDALLLDLNMPRMNGAQVLEKLRAMNADVPVLVITAFGAIDSALEATKLGAQAYVQKPFDLRDVEFQLERVLKQKQLAQQFQTLKGQQTQYGKLVGESEPMQRIYRLIDQIASADAPTVLISGESGSGKDLVAQAIHTKGKRSKELFMAIDCASLPEQLVESELFGHERGAFTDAKQMKRGLFEVVGNGTVFLDEIGEMSLNTQSKFLRALENRRFKRVGGVSDLPLTAAVVAATNRSLGEQVKAGRFREDLYFRLHIVPINMPALRERPTDVPLLIEHFIHKLSPQFGRQPRSVSPEAMRLLQSYGWPGNVRELRNVVERILILSTNNDVIDISDLPSEIGKTPTSIAPGVVSERQEFALPEKGVDLEGVEKSLIEQALARTAGNQSRSAKLLGITRFALRYRMEKHGLMPHQSRPFVGGE